MQNNPLLAEVLTAAAECLGAEFDQLRVERVVVGLFFTGVKLSDGCTGSCVTPLDTLPNSMCCALSTTRSSPARLAGTPASLLAQDAVTGIGIRRAVGIATLNALAEAAWRRQPDPAIELTVGVDAFDATAIRPGERVVIVGAFIPFLKELKRRKQPYLVLEQNPALLKGEEMPYYRPADQAAMILPEADVVLITGATLVNNTLEDLLAMAPAQAKVTVIGPTVGMLAAPFFARGADVLGSIRITAPDVFLDLLAEGASPQQFFKETAEKVVLARKAPHRD